MALIDQVKRKLNITWSDEDTDARLNDIIASVEPALKFKLGITDAEFDFSVGGQENALFLALCLYEFNHSANEFDANYANEIAQCRARHEVAYHLAQESEGEDDESAS